MYDINIKKEEGYYNSFYFKTKNELNQIIYLDIHATFIPEFGKGNNYSVTFQIMTKRKHGYQYLKQTGKDGIKSLIWAKNCIKYFIENKLKENDKIIIYADDKQRFNVYTYGLKELGFIFYNNSLIYKK